MPLITKSTSLVLSSGDSSVLGLDATKRSAFTVNYSPPVTVPASAVEGTAEIGLKTLDVPYTFPNITGTNTFKFTVSGTYGGAAQADVAYNFPIPDGSWDIMSFQDFLNLNCEDLAHLPDSLFTLYESKATGKITIAIDHYMSAPAETGGEVILTNVTFLWNDAAMAGIAGLLGFNTDGTDPVTIDAADEGNITQHTADVQHTFENAVTEIQLRSPTCAAEGRGADGGRTTLIGRLDPRGQAEHGGHIHMEFAEPTWHTMSSHNMQTINWELTDQTGTALDLRSEDFSALVIIRWQEIIDERKVGTQLGGSGYGY